MPCLNAPRDVFYIDCEPKSALSKRHWQGKIIGKEGLGKGLHGYLNALCIRIDHKYKGAPLMRLLTICINCCAELELDHEADQIGRIFGFRDNSRIPREMLLRISYKEIKEIVP
jgi:hypothetical protein